MNPSIWERIGTYVGGQTPPLSIESMIDTLILVFPGLTNLTRFEVESWDMSPNYNLEPFFRSAWASFGRQLETISMAGRPEVRASFAPQ